MMDTAWLLGYLLLGVGGIGVVLHTVWLWLAIRGIKPAWFSDSAKRMAPGRHVLLAAASLAGSLVAVALGLALLFVPEVRDAAIALLRAGR